jgi:hypothetical protein
MRHLSHLARDAELKGLIAEVLPENTAMSAPVAVLAGHANDQLLDFSGNPRSARTSTSF